MKYLLVNQKNKRLRGPNLSTFRTHDEGVPMEEALSKANEEGLVIASNKRLSMALVGSEEWKTIHETFRCWTGTMAAYEKPDQKLGNFIETVDPKTGIRYVFPVPDEHVGKKNVILVAEHPDFALETFGKTKIVQAKNVGIVTEFPVDCGEYFLGDPKYDIPQGSPVSDNGITPRRLFRIEKNVCLLVRLVDDCDWRRQSIAAGWMPSSLTGAAVESL